VLSVGAFPVGPRNSSLFCFVVVYKARASVASLDGAFKVPATQCFLGIPGIGGPYLVLSVHG